MKRYIVAFLVFTLTVCATVHGAGGEIDTLTQVSTIDALLTGVYDGDTSLRFLGEKGDFGIGTFNGLNGEMVLLDGRFYRITAAGQVEQPNPATKTPFATVTFFEADRTVPLAAGVSFKDFEVKMDKILPTPNIFYAIKISGIFDVVRTRSVPAQEKPYRPLSEVVKEQKVFDLRNVEGIIVGFHCPSYVKGVNVPGYHLHFLSSDLKSGGHVFDFVVRKAVVRIDDSNRLYLLLPSDSDFYCADLAPDREKELKAVEK